MSEDKISFKRFERTYVYPLLAFLASAFMIVTWLSVRQWSAVLDNELLRKGTQLARNLSRRSQAAVLLGDRESSLELIREIRQGDPDITAAAIYDLEGKILVNETSAQSLPARLAAIEIKAGGTLFPFEDDRICLEPIVDKSGKPIGISATRLSNLRILRMVRLTTGVVVFFALAAWIIVGALFSWLMRQVKNLGQKESLLANITFSSPDAIIMTDADTRIRFWNKAAEELFGWTAEELVGRNDIETIVLPEDMAAAQQMIARSVSETVVRAESRRKSKNGEIVAVDITLFAARNDEGQITGQVMILRDLRETQMLRKSLIQSEKMSAVGQLAGGVAHEINNPLGVILGFAQSAVRRVKADEPMSLPLRSIEREAIRCKNLVQNLLVFSRASTSEQREEIDFNAVVEESMSLVMAQCRVKGSEVHKDLGAGLPRIRANKNQIQQIIVNLGNNALDAMPAGGRLTVRAEAATKNGQDGIIFEMSDTGSGIPENIKPKIFEPFFTTKEVGKGTGLGLSLVYEIVQKHQGLIEVNSEVGRGTTFTIFLPATISQVQTIRR